MVTDTLEDPAEIEREIRQTQDEMSSTVDKIGDQLSVKNVFNALLDKADTNNINARMIADSARRNPLALGLIAAGAIWLVSEYDAKLPKIGLKFGKKRHDYDRGSETGHDDYVSHMSSFEQEEDEDAMDYGRRRDTQRSGFFNVKRNEGEDDISFRARLDLLAEKLRNKRPDWTASSEKARYIAQQKAEAAFYKTQSLYNDNPLVGGLLAAAVGVGIGSTLPITRQEKEKLAPLSQKARDAAAQQKERVAAQIRDKKNELLDKADAAIRKTASSENQYNDRPGQSG
jgi:hypothetical protein